MINLDDESDVLHNADNLFFIPFMHIWWKEHRYFYDTTFCHSCKCWIHAISGEINLLNNISPLIIWWYWKKKTSICLISKRRQVFSSLMISIFFNYHYYFILILSLIVFVYDDLAQLTTVNCSPTFVKRGYWWYYGFDEPCSWNENTFLLLFICHMRNMPFVLISLQVKRWNKQSPLL